MILLSLKLLVANKDIFKLLCLIGEAFENSDEVCGAVVNIRGKGDKIGKLYNLI